MGTTSYISIILSFIALIFTNSSAMALCGEDFTGLWRDLGHQQGQYYGVNFQYGEVNNTLLILDSYTMTGTEIKNERILGKFFTISYSDRLGNMSAQRNGRVKCLLTFGRPKVGVDVYGAARNIIARKAQLTLQRGSIRWCWLERGHVTGDCFTLKKV